jgi:hypothetical protein
MHGVKLALEILLGYFAVSLLSGGAWIALVKFNGRRALVVAPASDKGGVRRNTARSAPECITSRY